MTNFIKHPLLSKFISFLISVIIVLIIFVGIIGIVIPLMMEGRVELVRIISLIFILIGALIIIISWHRPIISFIYLIRKKKNVKIDVKVFDFIGSLLIGFSFLAAGLVYIRSKDFIMMLIPFTAGIFFIRAIIYYLNHKIKTLSSIYTPPQEKSNND